MLLLPGLVGRALFGTGGASPVAKALLRLVGVRDLVLGVGAITTVKEDTMNAEWVGMGAVADAVDGVVALITPGLPSARTLVALVGGGAATVRPDGGARAGRRRARSSRQRSIPDSSGIQPFARSTASRHLLAIEFALRFDAAPGCPRRGRARRRRCDDRARARP